MTSISEKNKCFKNYSYTKYAENCKFQKATSPSVLNFSAVKKYIRKKSNKGIVIIVKYPNHKSDVLFIYLNTNRRAPPILQLLGIIKSGIEML